MIISTHWSTASLAAAAATATVQAATVTLPAGAAGAAGSASERGFVVRVAQAPEAADIPNNYVRALQQLNGTLVDKAGVVVPNEATPGSNADGSYNVDTLNFEREAAAFDVVDGTGNPLWGFTPSCSASPVRAGTPSSSSSRRWRSSSCRPARPPLP